MKKLLYLFLTVFIVACSGEDNGAGNTNTLEYLGTYRGDIDVYINENYHSTLYSHSMTFVSIGSSNEVMIEGNLIITNTCVFNAAGFVIPETIAVSTPQFYALEYGEGVLSGNSLQIELHQDQVNNETNEISATATWLGTLSKVE
jgi:hypothetical protein